MPPPRFSFRSVLVCIENSAKGASGAIICGTVIEEVIPAIVVGKGVPWHTKDQQVERAPPYLGAQT